MSSFRLYHLYYSVHYSIGHQAAKVHSRKNRGGQSPVPWKHMGRPAPRNDGQLIDRAILEIWPGLDPKSDAPIRHCALQFGTVARFVF
jgi:hypothetical protein